VVELSEIPDRERHEAGEKRENGSDGHKIMQVFRSFCGLRGPNAFQSTTTQEQIVRAPPWGEND
jgi:hypothetical protein